MVEDYHQYRQAAYYTCVIHGHVDRFSRDTLKKKVHVDNNTVKYLNTILKTVCSKTNINYNGQTVQYALVLSYMAVISKP